MRTVDRIRHILWYDAHIRTHKERSTAEIMKELREGEES